MALVSLIVLPREEVDLQAVGGDDTLRQELDERASRIASLGEELNAARAELDELKSNKEDGNGLVEAAADPGVGHVEGEGVPGLVHGEEVADKR